MFNERIISKDYSISKTQSFYDSLNSRMPENPSACSSLSDLCDTLSTPTMQVEIHNSKLRILVS